MDMSVYIQKEEEEKVNKKMIEDFGRKNFSGLIRTLINFLVSEDSNKNIKITEKDLKYKSSDNPIKKNAVRIDKKDIQKLDLFLLSEKKIGKRNDLIKILINKWLNGKIKIKKEELN